MSRRPFIAGNWKMNLGPAQAGELASELKRADAKPTAGDMEKLNKVIRQAKSPASLCVRFRRFPSPKGRAAAPDEVAPHIRPQG